LAKSPRFLRTTQKHAAGLTFVNLMSTVTPAF
jgi:hypothetical protein